MHPASGSPPGKRGPSRQLLTTLRIPTQISAPRQDDSPRRISTVIWRTCLIIAGLVVLNAALAAVILTAVRGFGRCVRAHVLARLKCGPSHASQWLWRVDILHANSSLSVLMRMLPEHAQHGQLNYVQGNVYMLQILRMCSVLMCRAGSSNAPDAATSNAEPEPALPVFSGAEESAGDHPPGCVDSSHWLHIWSPSATQRQNLLVPASFSTMHMPAIA